MAESVILPPMWAHQTYACSEVPRRILAGEKRLCLTSPTGGGKTRIVCELIEWAVAQGWKAIVYTNRRLLIDQLARVLTAHGLTFGIRAAGHEDNRQLDVQVSSLPTENSRVFKMDKWQIHGHGVKTLALIDEAHLNKAAMAEQVLKLHVEHGGAYVGITATPIDLKHLYDSLVVAGTMDDLRKCGCLVPAMHYGPDEPDMQNFKQNVKTGEYSEGDVKKAIMTKAIFGRVLDQYRILNPHQRPTVLFAPGVEESIWFAEQLCKNGIKAAHIDGKGVWMEGEYYPNGPRDELLASVRDGYTKIICNRFVLREGLDIPELSHAIAATIMGSLQTWLQSMGRILRACSGKTQAAIQDHGGHYWRHGSVNADRAWELGKTETDWKEERAERIIGKKEPEPIRCPQCGLVRASGPKCPQCGHESTKRTRIVMQSDGSLRQHEGDVFKPKTIKVEPNTAKLWSNKYYQAKNSKNRMTFRQAEAMFFLDNHYYPPRTLPLMPIAKADWSLPVADVPYERLIQKEKT